MNSLYKQKEDSINCMQCCVAYMFGLRLEDVPDFTKEADPQAAWESFVNYIASQGYSSVLIPGKMEYEADYLASGKTIRGTSHMVVMNDGKLVHDPHPSNAGLSEIQAVWLIVRNATPIIS